MSVNQKLIGFLCLILPLIVSAGENLEQNDLHVDEVLSAIEKQNSDSKSYRQGIKENLSAKGQIIGIQKLPISKIYFVEAQQGIYLVSADGRFIFSGEVKDVWHRKTIATLADARATERVPIGNIGFNPEEKFASFIVGNQNLPRQGVVFVDPTSKITQKFLQLVLQDTQKYNFTIVLMPMVGGDRAVHRARQLWCAKDHQQAVIDLSLGTDESTHDLRSNCSEEPIVMAMMTTEVFQITGLPHFIREDGLTSSGLPKNLDDWLAMP